MSAGYKVGFFSSQPYDQKSFDGLLSQYPDITVDYHHVRLSESTVALAYPYDAICCFVNDELNEAVIEQLSQAGVKHIALRCAGFNNVDIQAAERCNIQVSRVPAYSPEAVAEHTLALIMTLNRRTHKAYNRVKEGNFHLNGLLGFNLYKKTIGVVGTGNIGQAAAKIFLGFGAKVICFDPYPNRQLEQLGVTYVPLDDLLTQSDIITLHCPLNEFSHHMINQAAIEKMKPGVMLINTSRGGLIDTHAVIDGLKARKIGYLGLDVYEMESELFFQDHSNDIIDDDVFERLATFHNVLITGHQGFFTQEALYEIATTTLGNIDALKRNALSDGHFISI